MVLKEPSGCWPSEETSDKAQIKEGGREARVERCPAPAVDGGLVGKSRNGNRQDQTLVYKIRWPLPVGALCAALQQDNISLAVIAQVRGRSRGGCRMYDGVSRVVRGIMRG